MNLNAGGLTERGTCYASAVPDRVGAVVSDEAPGRFLGGLERCRSKPGAAVLGAACVLIYFAHDSENQSRPGTRGRPGGVAHRSRRHRTRLRAPRRQLLRSDFSAARLPRARGRHRNGQIGPQRPQTGRHVRQHRHTRLLRSPGRSQPRGPGHDHDRRRRCRPVQLRRDGGTGQHSPDDKAHRREAHRHDRQRRLQPGAPVRRAPRRARRQRSLPAGPRTDRQHHGRSRPGRCACRHAARRARFRRRGLRPVASGRRARSTSADVRARCHAHRRAMPACPMPYWR